MADFYTDRDITMTPLTWKSIAPPITILTAGLNFRDHLCRARVAAARYSELSSMSAVQLKRRGLSAEDLAMTAYRHGFSDQ